MDHDFSFLAESADPIRRVPAGQTLFDMGDHGTTLFVVREGEVRVQVGDMVLESVRRGGVVGEMALVDDDVHVRSATAVATTACDVVEIDRARLMARAAQQPDIMLSLVRLSVRRLRATTFLTYHDAVTQLPNRFRFQELSRTALARAHRRGSTVALLQIRLTDFKSVNALIGHAAGDELLRAVGRRVGEVLHELDTIARLSSAEIGVLLEDLQNCSQAAAFAERVLQALARPYQIAQQSIFLSANIGISCYPQDGADPAALLKCAESATQAARQDGHNGYRYFSSDLHAIAIETLNLSNHLHRALERGELRLNYQPRVDISSGRIAAVEALLRWQHPELGWVPPGKFIPIAEQTGMIDAIGDWVLQAACLQLKEWRTRGLDRLRLAVNLSPRQLRRPDLAAHIGATIKAVGVPANRMELEITESSIMDDPARTAYTLKALRTEGIAVAIDDFGTEYASLGFLKQFPLDCMKIDQSFVRGLPDTSEDVAITRAVITLAKHLKLKTVAEGVETRAQLDFLAAQGCDEYQGFFYARPMPAEEVEKLVRSAPGGHN